MSNEWEALDMKTVGSNDGTHDLHRPIPLPHRDHEAAVRVAESVFADPIEQATGVAAEIYQNYPYLVFSI